MKLVCQIMTIKKSLEMGLFIILVTRTGFEPMNACVKGMCVEPLHQRARNGGPEWT